MIISLGLMLLVLCVPFLQEVFQLIPMNSSQWGIVVLLSLVPLVIVELVKLGQYLFQKCKHK